MIPQALSRIEARLLPEIDAERRVLPRFTSPLVAEQGSCKVVRQALSPAPMLA